MKKISVSAPGKLMLFGEHAVVYDKPCLVTAVNQRLHVTIEETTDGNFYLDAPDVNLVSYTKPIAEIGKGDIPKAALFVEMGVKNVFSYCMKKRPGLVSGSNKEMQGIRITTSSEFSSKFGFGSSSASAACVVFALSELLGLALSKKEIFELAYTTVLDIQGKGSGYDIAAAVYGGTLYFVTGGKVIEPITIDTLPLVVGYSGTKADTVSLINEVKERFKDTPQELDAIYNNIGAVVEKAKEVLLEKDWQELGNLMKKNQTYLQQLDVSIPKLDDMITAANTAGAYGAKLSGAGGGDCMIALCSEENKSVVQNAIKQAGGEILSVQTNTEGVRGEV